MRNQIKKTVLMAIMWVFSTLPTYAQGYPVNPPAGDDPIDEPGAPIDNWYMILVAIAVLVGVYVMYRSRRKSIA